MTLPVSGAISFNNINVELGVAGTTQASLGQTSYRTLAGVASGAISMSNFYGKSNRAAISYTFSSNTANATLNLSTISGYAAGTSDITVTINSGVYLYSTSTGGYGLNISGGTTGDTLTIVNDGGKIMGMGGAGGFGNSPYNGNAGGPALNLGFGMSGCTINNTNASAYIGGGGGGGGGCYNGKPYWGGGGGGAGGGAGGRGDGLSPGGSGGGVGASGSNGTYGDRSSGGGGGGRVFPGTGGAGAAGDGQGKGGSAGGGGGAGNLATGSGGNGGSGNAAGQGGIDGGQGSASGGGGGGWGAAGGVGRANGVSEIDSTGGAGGKAVNLNGKTVTWTSGNTTRVYGAVS